MSTSATLDFKNISAPSLLPGSFDVLHTLHLFPSNNALGIPTLPYAPLAYIPRQLVGYRTKLRDKQSLYKTALHFFLDDYRFESVWACPEKARTRLESFPVLLTPDFSLYADWPLAAQQWNTYRSRWCGALWTSWGMRVIPTVSWSTPASYAFCFAGIARQSVVAVSTVGVRVADRVLFEQGYYEMLRQLQPRRVLCYGRLNDLGALADLTPTTCFPPDQRYVHHE